MWRRTPEPGVACSGQSQKKIWRKSWLCDCRRYSKAHCSRFFTALWLITLSVLPLPLTYHWLPPAPPPTVRSKRGTASRKHSSVLPDDRILPTTVRLRAPHKFLPSDQDAFCVPAR